MRDRVRRPLSSLQPRVLPALLSLNRLPRPTNKLLNASGYVSRTSTDSVGRDCALGIVLVCLRADVPVPTPVLVHVCPALGVGQGALHVPFFVISVAFSWFSRSSSRACVRAPTTSVRRSQSVGAPVITPQPVRVVVVVIRKSAGGAQASIVLLPIQHATK